MNAHVDIRMTRARSQLVMDAPFFGSLIMRMRILASNAIETMATDGTDLWYCPSFLDTITEAQILGILVHELFHCILGHHVRRGDRDHKRWNIACDYVVNLMVLDAGFELPNWMYIDRQYAGLNAEQVYKLLEDEEQAQQQPQQEQQQVQSEPESGAGDDDEQSDDTSEDSSDADDGDQSSDDGEDDDAQDDDEGDGLPDEEEGQGDGSDDGEGDEGEGDIESGSGNGSGADDHHEPDSHGDPGRCGEILDAAPPHDKAALSEAEGEWEIAVRQAVSIAKRQGNMPGFVKEIIEKMNDPGTNWRDVLDRFIDPSTTKDFSYANPSRRMLPFGLYVPGTVSDGISHAAFIIDSSYSIDTETLRKVGAKVQDAIDDGRIDKLTVIFCDTRVTKVNEYTQGDVIDWEIPGRGGTAFRPAFEWLNENAPDIQCAIYFTDMECSDYGPEPAYPVLWAGYGDPRRLKPHMDAAPWGECVDVNQ
jgi:predicted metal-dependent peptidase